MTTKLNTQQTRTARAAKAAVGNSDTQRARAEHIAAAQAHVNGFTFTEVPSNARLLASAVGQLVAFSASFYWGVQVAGWLAAAAIASTGSAFIALCAVIVGAVLAFHAAWKAGRLAEEVLMNLDFTSLANTGRDLRIAAAKRVSIVRGWFTPTDRIEVEAAR